MRHVEALRLQKQEEENVKESLGGRSQEENDKVFSQSPEPQTLSAPESGSPDSQKTGSTQSQVLFFCIYISHTNTSLLMFLSVFLKF